MQRLQTNYTNKTDKHNFIMIFSQAFITHI